MELTSSICRLVSGHVDVADGQRTALGGPRVLSVFLRAES
jgi:hypothetical protein